MEAIGPVLILVSIPLILRLVPRNSFYGLRIPPTCNSESVWYDANALCGRHLLTLGLAMVALEFVLPRSMRTAVLATIGWSGFFTILVVDWRIANRWYRERDGR
jgi:uncharacterized membrane protein